MCLPWCCWPFVDVELEDPPPKKDKEEKRYIMVEDGSLFYPVSDLYPSPLSFHFRLHNFDLNIRPHTCVEKFLLSISSLSSGLACAP